MKINTDTHFDEEWNYNVDDLVNEIIDSNKHIACIEVFARVATEALSFMPKNKILFYTNTFINNNKINNVNIGSVDYQTLLMLRQGWAKVKKTNAYDYKKSYYAGLTLNLCTLFLAAYKQYLSEDDLIEYKDTFRY